MADLATTPADLASPRGGLPVPLTSLAKGPMGGWFERVGAFTRQPAVAKSLPMMALIALLGVAALAWAILHQPPQRDLFTGLGDADKAAVVQALDTAGVKYHLDSATGELTVPEDSYYRAKMLLASQGLPKSAPNGDQLIASLPMGASRAVEGERLREAREEDLARTIEAIDAVQAAKVHLAVEQPSVFLRDDAKPQASVMLTLRGGRTLSDSQVQAIIHLVSGAVPGLSPDDVSVVDQEGHLLSRHGDGGDDALDQQVALQTRVEDRYRQALSQLLTPLVGDGNFTAEVHADLDFAETASTVETYPKDGGALRTEQGSWSNNQGGDQPAMGIPGALSNSPPTPAKPTTTPNGQPPANGPAAANGPTAPGTAPGQASAGVPQKLNETYNRSYELGHQVSVTRNPVGSVRRLTVAVALREAPGAKPLTAQQQQQIENLVKGAVGFDQQRGDLVTVTQQNFAAADAAQKTPWYQASWLGPVARNVTALLVAALLVFGLGRPLLKRRAQAAEAAAREKAEARTAIGQEIARQIAADGDGHADHGPVTLEMIESAPGYAARAALIRNFVRQDPARAALVVRDLIRADSPKPEKADG